MTRATFASLLRHAVGPVVTVSVPLDPVRPVPTRDHAVLKGLAHHAAELLEARPDVDRATAASVLAMFDDVLARERFDVPGARGVVLVSAPGLRAHLAVPTALHESVHVGQTVHVLPLLPAREVGEHYAVLCLSEADVAYFEGDGFALHARDVPDMPHSLDEALWYEDEHRERHLGLHQATPQGGHLVATVHGGGAERDARHDRLRRFLRQVDYAVGAHLGSVEPLPVVLVGVEDIVARYAQASHYPWLVSMPIGNASRKPVAELHEMTWDAARRQLRLPLDRALAAAADLQGTGLVTAHPGEAAEAAVEGQVSTLLLAERWCAPCDGRLEGGEPAQADDVNTAVVHTLRHRGTVGLVGCMELGDTGLLARLRY